MLLARREDGGVPSHIWFHLPPSIDLTDPRKPSEPFELRLALEPSALLVRMIGVTCCSTGAASSCPGIFLPLTPAPVGAFLARSTSADIAQNNCDMFVVSEICTDSRNGFCCAVAEFIQAWVWIEVETFDSDDNIDIEL